MFCIGSKVFCIGSKVFCIGSKICKSKSSDSAPYILQKSGGGGGKEGSPPLPLTCSGLHAGLTRTPYKLKLKLSAKLEEA